MNNLRMICVFSAAVVAAAGTIILSANAASAVDSTTDDIVAIEQLLNHYCHALDRGEVERVMEGFHPDARLSPVFEGEDSHQGTEAVRAWYTEYANRQKESTALLRHTISTSMIDINGEEASAVTYLDADWVTKEGNEAFHVVGRYEDKLTKQDGRWLVLERRIILDRTFLLELQPAN